MWVKVCGIRDVDNAAVAVAAGADAIGLNFYPRSPRYVQLESARRIVASLPENVEPVGLFVNATRDEIAEVVTSLGLRTVQLHGDESAEFVAATPAERCIRVYRVDVSEGLTGVAADLSQLAALGATPWRCLVDARVDGAYGGTGHRAPWELLRDGWFADWPPLILAGGLTPENVGEGVRACAPWGVDVASGVEASAGVKDAELTSRFVRIARSRS
ncbi:MAG: phosphoribosylanthranilate isomerase [Planctomycetaceae bacterium]